MIYNVPLITDLKLLLHTALYEYKSQVQYTVKTDYIELVISKLNTMSEMAVVSDKIEEYLTLDEDGLTALLPTMFDNVAKDMSKIISNLLDAKAKEYGYDDIKSVRSYTGFDNIFKDECLIIATWGSDCWATAGQIRQDVEAGLRQLPNSPDELLAELPVCPI